ncbi:MAG: hypothetical protein QOJ76_55 [Acidobacteriota bacterium]|nr:hypothetical protein [Acidobacteriota bacterium]
MANVLTETSQIVCAHAGKVQATAGQSKLRIAGSRVLVLGDVVGAPVAGCVTPPDPNTATTPCIAVASAGPQGVAAKLRVGGRGVLLDALRGQTSGTVSGMPQTWSVVAANQTKLTAK